MLSRCMGYDGCNGGWVEIGDAYDYLSEKGICTGEYSPGNCSFQSHKNYVGVCFLKHIYFRWLFEL